MANLDTLNAKLDALIRMLTCPDCHGSGVKMVFHPFAVIDLPTSQGGWSEQTFCECRAAAATVIADLEATEHHL